MGRYLGLFPRARDRVMVCDDRSTDDTRMILDSLDVDIVRHERNQGYGAALVSLFKYCQSIDFDYAVTIDADGQHDPKYIPALIDPIKHGPAGKVLELETAKAVLAPLASANSHWEVELRAVSDGDAPRVVVTAGDDMLSTLVSEVSG